MATKTFAQATEEPATTTLTNSVPDTGEKAIVTNEHYSGASIEGEIAQSDLKLPRINLVQKIGELGEQFTPGSLVFIKEIVLSDGKTPVQMTVLKGVKRYQEDLPFDSEEFPQSFATAKEVRDNGGSFEYGDEHLYTEIAHFKMLIAAPESVRPDQLHHFAYEFEGTPYALAAWTMNKTAYNSAGKTIISAAFTHLKEGLHRGKWEVTTQLRKTAKFSWYIPNFKTAGIHTPEFIEFAEALI